MDVSSRFLADVEAGKVGVSLHTLKRLCIVLGTTADNLLGITEENPSYYQQIETRLKQIPVEYLPHMLRMIEAFSEAVRYKAD